MKALEVGKGREKGEGVGGGARERREEGEEGRSGEKR